MKNFTTTYEDLTTLAELAYLGHYVLNNFKRENHHEKHEAMFMRIANEYKSETLKSRPDKAKELRHINDYFITRCDVYATQFEREHFAEILSLALQSYKVIEFQECRKTLLSLFKND